MPMYDRQCKQGHQQLDCWEPINSDDPPCPECGQPTERAHWLTKPAGVIGDDIPGGLLIENTICHDDGSPKRYYSKSEIRKAAAAKGYSWGPAEHVGERGSDKSRHTTRWI